MCGIAGYVSNDLQGAGGDASWVHQIADVLQGVEPGPGAFGILSDVVGKLENRFSEMMSLASHRAAASDDKVHQSLVSLADALDQHEAALVEASRAGRTDLDPLIEGLRDYGWQIRRELLGHVARVETLISGRRGGSVLGVGFAVEHVLAAIDKLEVRGRDSAGIVIQLALPELDTDRLEPDLKSELATRIADIHAGHRSVTSTPLPDGGNNVGFIYKTANLIGSLGDNGAVLRDAVRGDALFWKLAEAATRINVLAHTRWASSGIISIPNCHPHNASVVADTARAAEIGGMFVLNGDVDNHVELLQELVLSRQQSIAPDITTDTKIIPIAHRFATSQSRDGLDRFRAAMRRLDGSMAVAMVDPLRPGEALLGQKGSGQGLHAAPVPNGWMFASEAYGLATITRAAYNLARSVEGGCVARLDAASAQPDVRGTGDGNPIGVSLDTIQIFPRDIFRGRFGFFLEKEIHDGPSSVAKTLRGRYRLSEDRVAFDQLPTDIWARLRQRLKTGLSRVYVIGQGTAGVAGVGIAHLIDRAISRDRRRAVPVMALRSSELSADINNYDFEGALVIAVSQSGTTTDTNRAVDLARDRGAFVHAIVNRRNSDLVRKADSVLFTSDGRDVEMSVASTKAYYSQIVAGKLTALFLADTLGTLSEPEIRREVVELETLPEKIGEVLEMEGHIAECARSLAPRARYWAVTGSGVNHFAALEIRIKLSELCYKSIPVDFTEDKKHIDLSTEPLTLVIATDLAPGIAGDVVKEVAIFKAHNGRPIVFVTRGPESEAFATYAERVIPLPKIGGELGFLLATVAGHIFGFHAARAIDEGATKIKEIMVALGIAAQTRDRKATEDALSILDDFVADASEGAFDSGLGGRDVAAIALVGRRVGAALAADALERVAAEINAAMPILRKVFEETSRPVDTIRHQAKTVTVGTSRPDDALSPAVRDSLSGIGISESRLGADDRKALAALSRLVDSVVWSAELTLLRGQDGTRIKSAGPPPGVLARYGTSERPVGIVGAAVDEPRVHLGRLGGEPVLIVPFQGDDGGEAAGFVCMAVRPLADTSREQKVAALKSLGVYRPRLRVWEDYYESEAETYLRDAIAQTAPEDLLFNPGALDPQAYRQLRKSA